MRSLALVATMLLSVSVALAADSPGKATDTMKAPAAPVERIDPSQSGEYTSGSWTYRYQIVTDSAGGKGRFGWLMYDGQRVPSGQPNDYYQTPWGPLYWAGTNDDPLGSHGWMLAAQGETAGKELPPPQQLKPDRTVTLADDGKTIELSVGDIVAIRLEGNPTTGYRWQSAGTPGTAVAAVGETRYERSDTAAGKVGAGGTFVFTYKAAQAGKATVKLDYLRPWEKDKAAEKTFTVDFSVKAKPNGGAK